MSRNASARSRGGRGTVEGRRRRRLRPTVVALEGRALLSTFTVTNTNDAGTGSLRQAISDANTAPNLGVADEIVFSNLFDTPQTITLTAGQLTLTDAATTTITGPGANLLSVNGNGTGRVFGVYGGSAALSGLTITGGSADRGGGLRNIGSTLALTNATVSGNSANASGGGLYTQNSGTTTLTNCTVSGNNSGGFGGGLANIGDPANFKFSITTLTNCTVSGNSAAFHGGGLFDNFGITTLTNCTVSGNSASDGGGLFNNFVMSLTNTIVAGQTAGGDVSGSISGSNNLIGGDPKLAPLGDYGGPTQTMALLPGSPAINAGTTGAGIPATDQRGFARVGATDIGAAEFGNPLVVNTTAGGVGSDPGQLSLRQAVNLANVLPTADTITFDPTVFPTAPGSTPQTITLTAGQLTLTDPATTTITGPITGPGANLLSVNGNHASRVFNVAINASAELSGLTITGGSADRGGGLDNFGTATLTNCTVSGNSATDGGGLFNNFGTATLTNCTVSGNSTAAAGGGLYNGGTATLTNCTVSGNNSANFGGGGLFNNGGTATLTNCTVSGNSTASAGGGLYNGGTATLTNCTVSGNSANLGGGLFNFGGLFDGSVLTLTNCTVSGNSAAVGGGLVNFGLFNFGTATLTNTIVAGQTAGGDITGSISGSNNLIGVDPKLAPLGDYGGPTQTMALLPGSPAIDAGTTGAGIPATDQRGFSRGNSVDIGAFQDQGFTLTPVNGSTPQTATVGTAFGSPLAVTVTANNTAQFINPVAGGVVTFTVNPAANGASATLAVGTTTGTMVTATIDANGQASVTATANAVANMPASNYTVTASAAGVTTPTDFSLTNVFRVKAGPTMTASLFLNLANTDDIGTNFDVQVEVLDKNNHVFASGMITRLQPSRVDNSPHLVTLTVLQDTTFSAGDNFSIRISTRINGGTGHSSGALQLQYDAVSRSSSLTLDYGLGATTYYLHESALMSTVDNRGDTSVNMNIVTANKKNGNPWVEMGTWIGTVG